MVRARRSRRCLTRVALVLLLIVLVPLTGYAQSPWERAALNLETVFVNIGRPLAMVAIIVGGLMFMYGEGGARRQIAGIVFGGGLVLFAAQFMAWLF